MGWSAVAVAAWVLAAPRPELVVVGVLDATPDVGVSALLDETAAWLQRSTALSMIAGDQVGLDRAALDACAADRLYGCLAKAILAVPSRPRLGVVIARARADGVLLLVFDAALVEGLVDADREGDVHGRVRRVSGRTPREALEALRSIPGFEAPARARIEATGCAGCVVRIARQDVALGEGRDLRLRAGPVLVELSRGGELLASSTATLTADRLWQIRIDVPSETPAWQPVLASGLLVGGSVLLGSGIGIASGRLERLCVSRTSSCDAPAAFDPRLIDYDSAGNTARALALTGAALVAAGVAWWVVELATDDDPWLSIE